LGDTDLVRLRPLFEDILVPAAQSVRAVVLDGGTDSGVMRLMGEARAAAGAGFPLVGVAPAGVVTIPGRDLPGEERIQLEANHTHFVLTPGDRWGDELVWIDRLAAELSVRERSVAVLINGGELARRDIQQSLGAGRPVVVIGGTGRLADELAGDPERHELIVVVDIDDGAERILDAVVSILKGA
jgi:hypothetical protein